MPIDTGLRSPTATATLLASENRSISSRWSIWLPRSRSKLLFPFFQNSLSKDLHGPGDKLSKTALIILVCDGVDQKANP